jgi:hypothetical protein
VAGVIAADNSTANPDATTQAANAAANAANIAATQATNTTADNDAGTGETADQAAIDNVERVFEH